MTRTYLARLRLADIWKVFLVAGVAALAFTLGSALIARGAPSGSTFYACVNRFTGQMRGTFTNGQCSTGEYQVSWNSFTGAELDDEYVNEDQPDSITSAMIIDGQVMNGDLAADSVTTDKILNETVNADDLGTNSVGADEIATGAVGADEVLDNSLTVDDLGTGSVGSDEVVNESLTAADLGTGSVGSDEIANFTIQSFDLSSTLRSDIDAETVEGYQLRQSITIGPSADPIIGGITMNCSVPGQMVVGGGVEVSNPVSSRMVESYPASSTSWRVSVLLEPGDVAYPYIICIGP